MSQLTDRVPPHYRALRALWSVLQAVLVLTVLFWLSGELPPGQVIDDVGDWARGLL